MFLRCSDPFPGALAPSDNGKGSAPMIERCLDKARVVTDISPSLVLSPLIVLWVWPPLLYPLSMVRFFFAIPTVLLTYRLPPDPPDEAFATKHMSDLVHDMKEFTAFHWKLQGWKMLERRLTSPEFDCGGHKWCVLLGHCCPSRVRNLKFCLGGYSSFQSVTPTLLRLPLTISIMSNPTCRMVGMLAPNSR